MKQPDPQLEAELEQLSQRVDIALYLSPLDAYIVAKLVQLALKRPGVARRPRHVGESLLDTIIPAIGAPGSAVWREFGVGATPTHSLATNANDECAHLVAALLALPSPSLGYVLIDDVVRVVNESFGLVPLEQA